MKRYLTLLLSFCFATLSASSVFAPWGFAETSDNVDAYALGMGGVSIGNQFRINTSVVNPSNILTANNVKIATAFTKKRVAWQVEGQAKKIDLNSYEFPYFNFIYPLKKQAFALAMNSGYLSNYDGGSTEKYETNIYRVGFVYGRKFNFLNLGVGAFNYGGSSKQKSSSFEMTGFLDNSFGFSAGFSKVYRDFSFGGVYTTAVDLADNVSLTSYSTDTTTSTKSYSMKLPNSYGAGLTYQIRSDLFFSTDIEYAVWKSSDFVKNSTNTFKYGFGISYSATRKSDKWYRTIPIRTGFFAKTLPFRANGKRVNEFGTTFGFSVPSKNQNNRIDFALAYTQRGNKSKNLRSDKSFNITVGLMGFDIFTSKKTRKQKRDIPRADRYYEDF